MKNRSAGNANRRIRPALWLAAVGVLSFCGLAGSLYTIISSENQKG